MISGIIFAILTLFYVFYIVTSGEDISSIISLDNLGIISLLLAVSFAFYAIKDYKIRKKRDWPHVQGKIKKAIETKGSFGGKKIRLVYTYFVSDREYTNDMFDFAQEDAKEFQIKMHPSLRGYKNLKSLEGKLVKVFYDKERPWKSAISRRINQTTLITTLPSMVVILFCLYYLVSIGISFF